MITPHRRVALAAVLLLTRLCHAASAPPHLVELPLAQTPADFPLVTADRAADIHVDAADFPVARIAAQCLADDIARITGHTPALQPDATRLAAPTVLIGTLGHSPTIDALVASGKIDPKPIAGQWESFLITTVANPLPGVPSALVIAGADRRGTAHGVFTLSESLGVSPWIWWADVPPPHRDTLTLSAGTFISPPPAVKYRGIFLNDEDFGLQPWAAKTLEPTTAGGTGDIGPKTYAKIFELLLRLKANYCWPAMHNCTHPFNAYPENRKVADDYAIVMGSSHAEPMLRNNVGEWTAPHELFDYSKNREGVLKYWQQRLDENGQYENTYTLGMRGIHDSAMLGPTALPDKVAQLQHILDDQRQLLKDHVRPDVERIPQIFVPYKEVLALYEAGLKVPDDVTLVFPDDNHGYIRRLPTPEEQRRPGGAGVYYHISYWGSPDDYLWLCTTPPALIWEEMTKAYDNGARTLWVLNVGDLKPGEIDADFFLTLARDPHAFGPTAQLDHLQAFGNRTFGPGAGGVVAALLNEYYELNYPARPEHLHRAHFTPDEAATRLASFQRLAQRAADLESRLSPNLLDPFYELVLYPIRCAALANEMHLSPDPAARQAAYDQIQSETLRYNTTLAHGKWRNMMSAHPHDAPALRHPTTAPSAAPPPAAPPKLPDTTPPGPSVSRSSPPAAGMPAGSTAAAGLSPRPFLTLSATDMTARSPTDPAPASTRNARSTTPPTWTPLPGFGRSGHPLTLLPTTALIPPDATLTTSFNLPNGAQSLRITTYCIPTLPLNIQSRLRYTITVDSLPPQTIDLATQEYSKPWSANVLLGASIDTLTFPVSPNAPATHTLTLHPLDPGVVFDKLTLDVNPPQ